MPAGVPPAELGVHLVLPVDAEATSSINFKSRTPISLNLIINVGDPLLGKNGETPFDTLPASSDVHRSPQHAVDASPDRIPRLYPMLKWNGLSTNRKRLILTQGSIFSEDVAAQEADMEIMKVVEERTMDWTGAAHIRSFGYALLGTPVMADDGRGFDRLRHIEIGKKYYKLTHFEEFKFCTALRGLGSIMILLVLGVVGISYYVVVIINYGPGLAAGDLDSLLAIVVLISFYCLVYGVLDVQRVSRNIHISVHGLNIFLAQMRAQNPASSKGSPKDVSDTFTYEGPKSTNIEQALIKDPVFSGFMEDYLNQGTELLTEHDVIFRRNDMLVQKGLKPQGFLKSGTTIVGLVYEWGTMSMCDAERRLLANALLDVSNEYYSLEVVPGDESRVLRVGTTLNPEVLTDLVALLRDSTDIFTWSPKELVGIDPEVTEHRLNISPDMKPVK
ncbi:probable inactive purple acid phosphatase 16 [Phtheirospermum japonicum]|uniref:Probable inactive purple acid phosphatase 16 n=1 Tax=Phtheirospermum japonicum TaxID=374723 RepID=A0A830BQN5_9LAMI|nr:probable inactive purple acid phosphatase 16 [Phtheirospermum japonicum]